VGEGSRPVSDCRTKVERALCARWLQAGSLPSSGLRPELGEKYFLPLAKRVRGRPKGGPHSHPLPLKARRPPLEKGDKCRNSRLWPSARAERAPSGPLFTLEPVKLTRNSVLTALVILMILWALPGAIQDTLQRGRVYLFSRQFLEELPKRFSGPGRLRFILQPLVAILFGVRCGLADAKSGRSPFIFALLFHAHKRKELLRSGITAIGHLLAIGILLDGVAQLLIYKQVHPGAALVIGPFLVCLPYAMARGLTLRLARRLQPQRSVTP